MFRTKLAKSCISAIRTVAKPVPTLKTMSFVAPVTAVHINTINSMYSPYGVQRRYFSTGNLSGKEILSKIEACGINDAGKEKLINEEVKKKNFQGIRDAAEE